MQNQRKVEKSQHKHLFEQPKFFNTFAEAHTFVLPSSKTSKSLRFACKRLANKECANTDIHFNFLICLVGKFSRTLIKNK